MTMPTIHITNSVIRVNNLWAMEWNRMWNGMWNRLKYNVVRIMNKALIIEEIREWLKQHDTLMKNLVKIK